MIGSPDTIKILLQIRAGDIAIMNQNNMEHFNRKVLPIVHLFTDCAIEMEEKIKSDLNNHNKSVLWYVMSDSSTVREYITNNFGEKVYSK